MVFDRIKDILDFAPAKFEDRLRWSCILRGIAMTPGLDASTLNELMYKANKFANDLDVAEMPLRSFLKAELLATQMQSESKMALAAGHFDLQHSCLEQMRLLDPNDSTAYSELGLLYFARSDWKNAVECFSHSVILGPPAMAMNAYFLGKSYLNLNEPKSAENNFLFSIELDDLAVSPIVELISLYILQNRIEESKKWAHLILGTNDLSEQLNEDEEKLIRSAVL
jgi:tetratricopeptide (TPR) repeat protein